MVIKQNCTLEAITLTLAASEEENEYIAARILSRKLCIITPGGKHNRDDVSLWERFVGNMPREGIGAWRAPVNIELSKGQHVWAELRLENAADTLPMTYHGLTIRCGLSLLVPVVLP